MFVSAMEIDNVFSKLFNHRSVFVLIDIDIDIKRASKQGEIMVNQVFIRPIVFLLILLYSSLLLAGETLKTKANNCPNSSICDGAFQNSLLLQHPYVDYLQGRSPEGFKQADLFSYIGNGSNFNMYWKIGNHWSSYHLLAKSNKKNDSQYTDGYYRYQQATKLSKVSDQPNHIKIPLERALSLAGTNESAKKSDIEKLEIHNTQTHAYILNKGNNKDLFGNFILTYNTYKELFGNANFNDLKTKLKNAKSTSQKADILLDALIRDSNGMSEEITGGAPCTVSEQTYNTSVPSQYCKWNHFGMGQSFENPLSLKKGFLFSTNVRLLDHKDQSDFNSALEETGLDAYNNHLNMRLQIQKVRKNPIDYFDARSNSWKTKTHDKIAISIPIIKPEELCLSEQIQSENKMCQNLTAEVVMESSILEKPDIGTGQYMYRLGKEGYDLGVETGGSSPEVKMRKFAEGKLLSIKVNDIPRFDSELKDAVASCNVNYDDWGIPSAWCDIEDFNWRNYEVTGINFGAEIRGVFRTALQINYINFQTY